LKIVDNLADASDLGCEFLRASLLRGRVYYPIERNHAVVRIHVNPCELETLSAANFVFTEVVIVASSTLRPAVLPVMA
jgi:hypothetical protein